MTLAVNDPILRNLDIPQLQDIMRFYDPLTWAQETARIDLPKQGPLKFDSHPYLVDIYRDTHPQIVAIKGAQIGMSTWAIVRALWAATTWPVSIVYSFPSSNEVAQYAQTRINPIINGSEYLADRIVDIDSVHVKRLGLRGRSEFSSRQLANKTLRQRFLGSDGLSTLYFSGALSPRDAVARDADMLIHDEEDQSDPEIIEMFRSRISGPSPFKWITRLSTPTIPGYGIDRAYRQSDQRHWLIRCPGCNRRFEMEFPACLEPQSWEEHVARHETVLEGQSCPDCRYICPHCQRPLSDEERGDGLWVAYQDDPGLPHGYQVSQMAALWIPANTILKARAENLWERNFWNLTMGVAHDEGTALLTKEALVGTGLPTPGGGADIGRCDPERPMQFHATGSTFMGVDVGMAHDVRVDQMVGGEIRTIFFTRTESWDDLNKYMQDFNVVTCVIDALPELHKAREFAAMWNTEGHTRVWLAFYGQPYAEFSWHSPTWRVSIPRTRGLSEYAEELLTAYRLPRYEPGNRDWEAFIQHHVNSKRVGRLSKGLEREGVISHYEWISTGADHQFHAGVYARTARLAPRAFAPTSSIPIVSLNRARNQGAISPRPRSGRRMG